jgi:hypothetical protein
MLLAIVQRPSSAGLRTSQSFSRVVRMAAMLFAAGCADATTLATPSSRVADLCDGREVRVSLALRVDARDSTMPPSLVPYLTTLTLRPTTPHVATSNCALEGTADVSLPLPFTAWAQNRDPITFRVEVVEHVQFGPGPLIHLQQGSTPPRQGGAFQARLYVRNRVFGFWDFSLPDTRTARGSVEQSL